MNHILINCGLENSILMAILVLRSIQVGGFPGILMVPTHLKPLPPPPSPTRHSSLILVEEYYAIYFSFVVTRDIFKFKHLPSSSISTVAAAAAAPATATQFLHHHGLHGVNSTTAMPCINYDLNC